MGQLMILCPKTKRYVPIGIQMDRRSFDSCELSNNRVVCAECGDAHVWDKKDVHWIEQQPSRSG